MMRIFWVECKHILRSRLLWCVALLGFFAGLYLHSVSVDSSLLTVSNGFVREHGTSFTEEDADDFVLYYLEHTEHGKEVQQELQQLGFSTITPSQIMRYQRGEDPELAERLHALREQDENAYDYLLYEFYRFTRVLDHMADNRTKENIDLEKQGKSWMNSYVSSEEQWKRAQFESAFAAMQDRVEEVFANGENQGFFPYTLQNGGYNDWFWSLFRMNNGLGFLWGLSFLLSAIMVARSLGGSFRAHRGQLLYTGRPGRRLVLIKMAAVLTISGLLFVLLTGLMTLLYVLLYRIDLYWNVPVASLLCEDGPAIPRFAVTLLQYWWFQLGVGLGCVLIMALLFTGIMALTKNFYVGSALMVLLVAGFVVLLKMVPGTESSFLLMSSPMGLFFHTGFLLMPFLRASTMFTALPHFEGYSLLVWGIIAAIVMALGMWRMRRASI